MTYKKLTFKTSSNKPHDFIGSKIRGALGYALKEEVCINPTYQCENCFNIQNCVFFKMFEEQNIVHKYRLDFILDDDNFEFSIYLFDELINYSQNITLAMIKSLVEYKNIEVSEESLEFINDNFSSIIKIEFETPLRIKKIMILQKKVLNY